MTAERAAKLETALALWEEARAMRLQRIRREHPGASDAELREHLRAWLLQQGRPLGSIPESPDAHAGT